MSDENNNTNNNSFLEDDLDMNSEQNGNDNEGLLNDDYDDNINEEERKVSDENERVDNEDEDIFDDKIEDEEENNEENNDNTNHELANLGKEEKISDSFTISKSKIMLAKALFENIKESNEKLIQIFSSFCEDSNIAKISLGQQGEIENQESSEDEGSIIEGVFDGENMIGPDGKQYSVPANYASKSKLVEGDILKLTITRKGTFVYKQIGPIERLRVIGELGKGDDDSFVVHADGKRWKILPASVTYFKGNLGDEVVLLVPKAGESKWAAVENIIRNKGQKEYLNNSF